MQRYFRFFVKLLLICNCAIFVFIIFLIANHDNNRQWSPHGCPVWNLQQCDSFEITSKWNLSLARKINILNLSRVLLVVHFNKDDSYDAIKWSHELYSRIFANIVFCGPGGFSNYYKKKESINIVSYLDWTENDSFFKFTIAQKAENFYVCIEASLSKLSTVNNSTDIYDKFDGILAMSDDVILNYWQLKIDNFTTSHNWLMAPDFPYVFDIDTGNFCDTISCWFSASDYWMWPKIYRIPIMAFYNEFSNGQEWQTLKNRLSTITYGRKNRLIGRTSADCFYIAKKYIREAVKLFRLFNKYRVYVEIAVPTTLHLISAEDNSLKFINTTGHSWATNDPKRLTALDIYQTNLQLAHPFKMSKLFRNFDEAQCRSNCLYCALKNWTQQYANLQNY